MSWPRAAFVLGAFGAFVVLLSPALLSSGEAAAITAAVLPLGFLAAGGLAQVLRPGHAVGGALLAVAVLHLTGIVGAVVAVLRPGNAWLSVPVSWLSAVLFALGFVALLDLLARYPTGRYAWAPVGPVVRAAAALAVVLVTLSFLGSRETPSVLELSAGTNPAYLPALAPVSTAALSLIVLIPVVGLGLLLSRYPRASALDRGQMRWPIVTAVVVALGLVTSGLAEDALGPDAQAALFIAAGAALPASFLVGLLRHTEQADRVAAVEASRARLAQIAVAERRRIERDLHDGAQQQLLALLARVELARSRLADGDATAERELRGIGEGIRQAHHDLRDLAQGIHPAILTDKGLGEAVRSALARLPLQAELVVSTEVEGARYHQTVEVAAYFLVLEGVTNAMKHAGATTVRVCLTSDGDMLEVTVSDPGPGLAATGGDGASTGLTGLRDRVAAVGGRLAIDSSPGTGTTLRGILPAHGHAAR